MNFTASFLALMFGAVTLFGQEAASPLTGGNGPLLAQAAAPGKDNAVTAINDRGAKDKAAAPAPRDSTTIAAPARPPGSAAAPAASDTVFNPVTIWKLVQSGGWIMVIMGFLSVVTVMLVL